VPGQVIRVRGVALLALAALAIFGTACGSGQETPTAGTDAGGGIVQVVASFYPIAFFAERIGGSRVDVFNPVPPGAEPHDLELSPRTVERIQGSRVLLYLGGGFQPAIDRALETLEGPELLAADVSEGITLQTVQPEEGAAPEGGLDPHVWLDPQLAAAMSGNIERALVEADPASEAMYRANAEKLRTDLGALDNDLAQGLSSCTRKEIVTSHAAFGYLARRYGLEEVPISGLSPESEPSPARLDEVIDLVKATGVTHIFFETLVEPRVAEVIASEVGAETLVLNPIEGLTEEQAEAGADYFKLMRENLANLRVALDCR
jgi:zinc transport system substrate-binding protein